MKASAAVRWPDLGNQVPTIRSHLSICAGWLSRRIAQGLSRCSDFPIIGRGALVTASLCTATMTFMMVFSPRDYSRLISEQGGFDCCAVQGRGSY
jgi:hypothetical protein